MPHFRNCELVQKQEISLLYSTLMVLIFAGTNFCGNCFFEKNCISRVLVFADGSFENFSRVLIFANRQKLSIFVISPKIEKQKPKELLVNNKLSIYLFKHLKCYNITTQINQVRRVRYSHGH